MKEGIREGDKWKSQRMIRYIKNDVNMKE